MVLQDCVFSAFRGRNESKVGAQAPCERDAYAAEGQDTLKAGSPTFMDPAVDALGTHIAWAPDPADDGRWFHDLLHADGTPYDPHEADALRRLTGAPN